MVKPHTSMNIYKVKSEEYKGRQQWCMVWDCQYDWYRLNKAKYPYYPDAMNMKTNRVNNEHDYYVAKTYYLKLNKW